MRPVSYSEVSELSDRLLSWYRTNGRDLPWRGAGDPYAIWVSEIMLQQTQVRTVIPYYARWMARFPTVEALAEASEQEVLLAWEGLGYYSRARNLHRAAKIVVREYSGRLPPDVPGLLALPGIGPYTAGAISSIAFGTDSIALDGNSRRVFARLFNISEPADGPEAESQLQEAAQTHLPSGRAGEYLQALMDLGATVCLARAPRCPDCPLEARCQARQLGVQGERPVKRPRPAVPTRVRAAAVIVQDGKVLLSRRPSSALLGGLWEFPNVPVDGEPNQQLAPALEMAYGLRVKPGSPLATIRHAYTHFRVVVHAFLCEPRSIPADLIWVEASSLQDYPMGKVDRQIAGRLGTKLEAQFADETIESLLDDSSPAWDTA